MTPTHYDAQRASPTAGARGWVVKGSFRYASDEGGESGGLPVRVQWTLLAIGSSGAFGKSTTRGG